MRALLPLIALVALSIGCSNSSNAGLGPAEDETASACRGESGNCGGKHNNNPNNPPATTP
jgi:hypothetical protein